MLMDQISLFSLTQAKLEKIKPSDKEMVEKMADEIRDGFKRLLSVLDPRKYPHARAYLENLFKNTLTFLEYWLERKVWIPLNTNVIESAFSRIVNRVKNIGKRWSNQGLINWLTIAFRKIFNPDLWGELWEKFLDINKSLLLCMFKIHYTWIYTIT